MPYAPPGSTTQTSALAHLATVKYEKRGLDRLKAKFRFAQICDPHPLPHEQRQDAPDVPLRAAWVQHHPSSEGVIGAPVPQSSSTLTATVEQYSDFESSSALLEETDINPTVMQMVEDVSYRASGSVDTIIRTEVDSNTGAQVSTISSYLAAADIKKQIALMEGVNVEPFDGDRYFGVIHPYVVYDLISDNTAGGFIDALKYASGQQVLNGEIGEIARCRFLTSTNVGSTGSSPNVQYYTYVFGRHGIGIVDLEGRGPDRIQDPKNEQFKVNVVKGGPNTADPVGEIGSFASYRFVFAAKTLDSTNYRFRSIKSDASII
jgi:N4-gp56 family major capsid protein